MVEWVFDAQSLGLKPAHASISLVPWHERLPAHTVVQRQAGSRFPAILHVGSLKFAARFEKLAVCLVHLKEIPELEAGGGIAGARGAEVELTRQ